MREILFRGKRKDNGEWVYGDLMSRAGKKKYIAFTETEKDACGRDTKGQYSFLQRYIFVEVIPETIEQFTGLHDKKGTKIFEGDIITQKDSCCKTSILGVVRWYETITAFRFYDIKHPDWVAELGAYAYEKTYTVIGNIHDNPELLKEEKTK